MICCSPNRSRVFSAALTVAVLVTAVLAALPVAGLSPNSDAMFPLTFVNDLLQGTAPFQWVMTPANGIFPDILIVLTARLAGLNDYANFAFFGIVYNVLVFLSFFALFRSAGEGPLAAAAVGFAGSLLFSFAYPLSFIQLILYSPAHHQGVLPILGFATAAVAAYLARNWDRPAGGGGLAFLGVAAVLCGLTLLSDFLMVVQFLAPMLAAVLALAWIDRRNPGFPTHARVLLIAVGAVLASMAIGFAAYKLLNGFDVIRQGSTGIRITPRSIRTAIRAFIALFGDFPTLLGVTRFVIIALGLVSGTVLCVAMLSAGSRRLPRIINPSFYFPSPAAKFVALVVVVSSYTSVLAPILVGTWVNVSLFRQHLPVVAFPPLIVGWMALRWGMVLFGAAEDTVRHRVAGFVTLAAMVAVGGVFIASYHARFGGIGDRPFLQPYIQVTKVLEQEKIGFAIAEYWSAKPMVHVAGGKVAVCGTSDTGGIYPWITNLGWCAQMYQNWVQTRGPLAFVADDPHLSAKMVEERFGAFERVVPVPGFEGAIRVLAWSEDLQKRVGDAICNAYEDKKFSSPDFCRR